MFLLNSVTLILLLLATLIKNSFIFKKSQEKNCMKFFFSVNFYIKNLNRIVINFGLFIFKV